MHLLPLTGSFAAEVLEINLAQPLTGKVVDQIKAAFADHMVLVFRDQVLTLEELESFALSFGSYGETPFIKTLDSHPNVLRVFREKEESGPLFGSGWHSDWSFQVEPPSATLLYGVEVPPAGGDTAFTNQYLAYETLSDVMKDFLRGLQGVHSARRSYGPNGTFGRHDPKSSMEIHGDEKAVKEQLHPLVRTHPVTGKKSLFINDVYTVGIHGMHAAESSPILEFLLQHSRQIQMTSRVRWAPGTLVMWDNRVVQHFAVDDYAGHRREMYRVTLAGEVPV